ncbi:MAG: RNA polymerase sigma factor FliA [Legionellaceae bacterium]|nr:RNA polymerase sigma factor FliA [Legionellaceae bacterium]MBP9775009.1 RNA polymerase sigma factor FliA [Legionellaceae bacterium]
MDALSKKTQVQERTQEALVKSHALLVKKIAYHLAGRLPRSILMDDLMQAGMLGLLEAVRSYDDNKGAAFETYASIRIRGFMLDEVRRNDWVPRSVYRNARLVARAVRIVENRHGREASDHDVAQELGLGLQEYHELLADTNGAHLYGFDDLGVTDDVLCDEANGAATEPQANVLNADFKSQLTAVIDGLPQNERMVLSLYYEHDLNLKEIGDVMGVTESRVSQIHSQATHRIRARLEQDR